MFTRFGQLLEKNRKAAGLSLTEFALMSGLTVARLQDLEWGQGEMPSFDTCYRLSRALASRSGRMFLLQDLWLALRVDKSVGTPLSNFSSSEPTKV